MIRLTFALGFDRGVWNGTLKPGSVSFGERAVGELGLLDLLEVQLGIKTPTVPSVNRKLDYLRAIRIVDNGKKFYSQSLRRDPMAVTERLISIRDALIEAGWQTSQIAGVQKVDELHEVEKNFTDRSGKSDRLRRVREELTKRASSPGIASIAIDEPQENLSSLWRTILEKELPKLGVKVGYKPILKEPLADPSTDLSKIQRLRSQPASPSSDGSVFLLTGRDPWESGRILAAYLAQMTVQQMKNTVIIAPDRHRGILKSALLAQGVPFGGSHSEISYARPALQILVLALVLAWEPKDPSAALALLTIEGSPVPRSIRYKLVRSLEESLAVGGKYWTETLDRVIESLKTTATTEEQEKIDKNRERIRKWFSSPAFVSEKGLPSVEVVAICRHVSDWLNRKWIVTKASSFREARDLSELLAALAQGLNEETISRERLLHLLMDSIGDGISSEGHAAQPEGPIVVAAPADITGPAETVIWWDFTAASVQGRPESSFSIKEIDKLRSSGISWPDAERTAVLAASAWTRPLLYSQKQIIFVNQLLDSDGNPDAYHPVLNELIPKVLRQNWMTSLHVKLLERELPLAQTFLRNAGATEISIEPHPFKERPEWKVNPGKLRLREAESASSLEQLLGCELAYTLRYGVRLQGEDRASLQYDVRVMGIIAHEVIAEIFPSGSPTSPAVALRAAIQLLDEVIKEKAPQLYQRVRARELAELKEVVLRAVESYASFLEVNKLTIEASELDVKKSEKKLGSVHLVGKIDHVLSDKHKNTLVMDHKWGSSKYKERDLAEGKSLQLALYSNLLNRGAEPVLAYHMITDNKILVLNKDFLQSIRINGPEAREILKEAETELSAKEAVLKRGNILAPGLSDENADQKFKAPCQYCEFGKVCGLAWKVTA